MYEKNYGIFQGYRISLAEEIIQNYETNDLFDFDFCGLCFRKRNLFTVKKAEPEHEKCHGEGSPFCN